MPKKFPAKDKDLAAHTLGAYRLIPPEQDVPPVRFSFGSIPANWTGEVQVLANVTIQDGDTQRTEPAGERDPQMYSVYVQTPDGTFEHVTDFADKQTMKQDAEALVAHLKTLHTSANEGFSPWRNNPRAYLSIPEDKLNDAQAYGVHYDENFGAYYTAQDDEHLIYLKKTYYDKEKQQAALKHHKTQWAAHIIRERARQGQSPLEPPAPKRQSTAPDTRENIAAQQQPRPIGFGFRNTPPRATPASKEIVNAGIRGVAEQAPSVQETAPSMDWSAFAASLKERMSRHSLENKVLYFLDAKPIFSVSTSAEDHYLMTEQGIDDDEAIACAILQAKDRFRDGIEITGDDKFKLRAIQIIAKYNIDVPLSIPEQQKMLADIRAQQPAPAQVPQQQPAERPPHQAQVIDINDAKQQRAQQTVRAPAPSM